MFESIHGRLVLSEPARCVVEAAGLGYDVHVPLSTFEALPAVGKPATLLVHLVVREDEWRLFGFATPEERDVFRTLLKVAGVGPALAMSLLSGFRPQELSAAVAREDVAALVRVKGVGKKTAERIVVELRDLWRDHAGGDAAPGAPAAIGAQPDAVRALVTLGLDPGDARRRVDAALAADADLPLGDLVRRALRS